MPPRVRKKPVRTCIVCRRSLEKKQLLRIIRTPLGTVEVDPTGKRSGRGAYVCTQKECRQSPGAYQQLSRALGVQVSSEMWSKTMAVEPSND